MPFGELKTSGRGPLTSSILSRCTLSISKRGDHTRSDHHYMQCFIAVSHSIYSNVNLKVNQEVCLEAIYRGRDLVAVLPT